METVSTDINIVRAGISRIRRVLIKGLGCSEILHVADHSLDLKLAAVFYRKV